MRNEHYWKAESNILCRDDKAQVAVSFLFQGMR